MWSAACERAFQLVKKKLTSASVLAFYDSRLPLRVAADASAYGISAVLTQIMPRGQERPVAFASRTMTSAERTYSQLERKALAIIYAVKKFHQHIYGRHFVLITDHQPLMTILSPSKGIPFMAAARLQRWAITLTSYSYTMEFKYSKNNASADALSRLLCLSNTKEKPEATFHLMDFDNLPVTAKQLATGTRRDPTLAKVLHWT